MLFCTAEGSTVFTPSFFGCSHCGRPKSVHIKEQPQQQHQNEEKPSEEVNVVVTTEVKPSTIDVVYYCRTTSTPQRQYTQSGIYGCRWCGQVKADHIKQVTTNSHNENDFFRSVQHEIQRSLEEEESQQMACLRIASNDDGKEKTVALYCADGYPFEAGGIFGCQRCHKVAAKHAVVK
eukprot:PhF_6_TR40626/c1_g1_i5/m.60956